MDNREFILEEKYRISPSLAFCMLSDGLFFQTVVPKGAFFLLEQHGFSKQCSTRLDYTACLIAEHYKQEGFCVTGFQIRQLMLKYAWESLRDMDSYLVKADNRLHRHEDFPADDLESEYKHMLEREG